MGGANSDLQEGGANTALPEPFPNRLPTSVAVQLEALPQPHSSLSKLCPLRKTTKSPGSSHKALDCAYRVFKLLALDLPHDFSPLHYFISGVGIGLERSPESAWFILGF